jgi:hypothetical protein
MGGSRTTGWLGRWTNGPLLLYHGTSRKSAASIRRNGIDLDRGVGASDFGRGFYTTTYPEQARLWARLKAGHEWAVLAFEVDRNALGLLDTLCFVRHEQWADDLWQFIWHNRLEQRPHRPNPPSLWYDVVYGPVARVWEHREAFPRYDQVSVHTRTAADLLQRSLVPLELKEVT